MCGIAGQARTDRRTPDVELLVRMCSRLEHRGPDSRGVHLAPGVGLGIQRLRVIDLLSGDQPIFNEDRTVAVVLNGEIYNHLELRRELERRGHRFATSGDTEVIAHLYEELGPHLVERLHGMFGLAVWDARRRSLLLARDRLGKKPLFYCERRGVLSFASEMQSLLEDREIPRVVDPQALDMHLALRYVPAPLTAFRDVRKLPPAHTLVFSEGRARIERYWSLEYLPKQASLDDAEVDDRLCEHLRRAVRRRLLADVPVGAFLSGGIDSAAVVAAMAEESPGPVRTFSIGFADERANELPAARFMAERFGTDHHELMVAPDAVELLPRIIRHHGEPFADPTSIPTFCLAQATREHVTVALTGDGGDETFGGYTRYSANLALQGVGRLPRGLRVPLGAVLSQVPRSGRIDSWPSRLRRIGQALPLEPAERYYTYISQLGGVRREDVYTEEFREAIDLDAPRRLIVEAWRSSDSDEALDRMLQADLGTYLPNDLLAKADIASMASSLELRCPLLDHELVEFAASLPASHKVRGMEKKVALRRALRGWVPDEILDAPKRGFHPPVVDWLRGDLGAFAREVLLDRRATARGHFRRDAVAGLLDRHTAGTEDSSELIWRLMSHELWHREFIDSSGEAAKQLELMPGAV